MFLLAGIQRWPSSSSLRQNYFTIATKRSGQSMVQVAVQKFHKPSTLTTKIECLLWTSRVLPKYALPHFIIIIHTKLLCHGKPAL